MTKHEFLSALGANLNGLPKKDREDYLRFYEEMIDDRTEDGLSEEDAVADIGSVDTVVNQIAADVPLSKLVKERVKPKKRLKAWEIVLLAVGSPLWFSLAIAAFAVVLSLYVCWWTIVICLWAIFVSFAACSIGGAAAGLGFLLLGYTPQGVAAIAAALVCAGVAILLFFGCKAATKGSARLTKAMVLGTKRCFMRKENEA